MSLRTVGATCALAMAAGCSLHELEHAAPQRTTATDSHSFCYGARPAVDVLIVVDNSPSMADEASVLQANLRIIGNFYKQTGFDYRIAVTSTDTGLAGCGPSEHGDGRLLVTSCRERPEAFVRDASVEAGPIDVWEEGCLDRCELESIELLPTTIHPDGPAMQRPWVEGVFLDDTSGVDPREVLPCLAPGVSGCVFETPLAAAARAIERSYDPDDPAYGFVRDHAALVVLFITDEDDCSTRSEHADVFEPEGDRLLWSNPEADEPTSAVCWNAGVECVGDPSAYDDCWPVHRGPDGALTDADGAVLEPVEDHVRFYEAIDKAKQGHMYAPDVPGVYVRVIAGIDGSSIPARLADALDEQTANAFGIGAACVGRNAPLRTAFPAPRLRAVAEAFPGEPGRPGESICEQTWSSALACIPGELRPPGLSLCPRMCPADTDPDALGIQPDCWMTRDELLADGSSRRTPMARCEEASAGEPCWTVELDPFEQADYCAERQGMEIRLRGSWDAPRATCFTLECEVSERPTYDCSLERRVTH